MLSKIDFIAVLEAILTGRQTRREIQCQTRLEIQCLYGNPMSKKFHKTSLLKFNKIHELETLFTGRRILQEKNEDCGCDRKRPVAF